jgi:hypothetical protein
MKAPDLPSLYERIINYANKRLKHLYYESRAMGKRRLEQITRGDALLIMNLNFSLVVARNALV